MATVAFIQASYQMVVAQIPGNIAAKEIISVVHQFQAPPGFRMHSMQPLKESVLVGQPHKVLMLFEHVAQVTQEVPDPVAEPTVEGEGNA